MCEYFTEEDIRTRHQRVAVSCSIKDRDQAHGLLTITRLIKSFSWSFRKLSPCLSRRVTGPEL